MCFADALCAASASSYRKRFDRQQTPVRSKRPAQQVQLEAARVPRAPRRFLRPTPGLQSLRHTRCNSTRALWRRHSMRALATQYGRWGPWERCRWWQAGSSSRSCSTCTGGSGRQTWGGTMSLCSSPRRRRKSSCKILPVYKPHLRLRRRPVSQRL